MQDPWKNPWPIYGAVIGAFCGAFLGPAYGAFVAVFLVGIPYGLLSQRKPPRSTALTKKEPGNLPTAGL